MGKMYSWLKLPEDFFRNKAIKKLRRIEGGDTYALIYVEMLLLAIKQDGKLYFEGIEESFAEELALDLDEEVEDVKATLQFLTSHGFIRQEEEDEYLLPECVSMIGSETTAAEKMRDLRKRRNNNQEVNSNNVITPSNNVTEPSNNVITPSNNVTKCYTDKEREKDKEKERNKEIDKDKKESEKEKAEQAKPASQTRVKNSFGAFGNVKLTPDELNKLFDDYGNSETQAAIDFLDKYIAEKGIKSKSHYLTLRRWVFTAAKEKKLREQEQKQQEQKQHSEKRKGKDIYAGIRDWNDSITVDAASSRAENGLSVGGIPPDWGSAQTLV